MIPESYPHYWINHLGFLIRKQLVREFAAAGHSLSAEEWAILLQLASRPGMSSTEVSDVTFRDRTTVTRMVDKLVAKGLVTRQPDTGDRRVLRLTLTMDGEKEFEALSQIARGLIARSFVGIDAADIDITVSTLGSMAENLSRTSS